MMKIHLRLLIATVLLAVLVTGAARAQDEGMEVLTQGENGVIAALLLTVADVGLSSDADVPAAKVLPDDVLVEDSGQTYLESVEGGERTEVSEADSEALSGILGGKGDPGNAPGTASSRALSGNAGAGRDESLSFDGLQLAMADTGSQNRSAAAGPRVFRVLASAEGLIGHRTATGLIIKAHTEAVALPSRSALDRKTKVVYLANDRSTVCKVLDVGPWNTKDAYWDRADGRPQAEKGRDLFGRRTNKAGIDIFNGSWYKLLGLRTYDRRLIENTMGTVEWNFEK